VERQLCYYGQTLVIEKPFPSDESGKGKAGRARTILFPTKKDLTKPAINQHEPKSQRDRRSLQQLSPA